MFYLDCPSPGRAFISLLVQRNEAKKDPANVVPFGVPKFDFIKLALRKLALLLSLIHI